MSNVISFTVPLPPRALRTNRSRGAHWATKHKAAGPYSEAVFMALVSQEHDGNMVRLDEAPWERARVTYTWRYASAAPDIDNIAGSLKVLGDTLCCAPAAISAKNQLKDRWYLGIIKDDRGIEAVFKREKVRHRNQEGVHIVIEELR